MTTLEQTPVVTASESSWRCVQSGDREGWLALMADDVVIEMGWGRLVFGQTFADPEKLAEVLRHEGPGRRDICMYAREPHVLVAKAPAELFIDPSHTYRLRFTDEDGAYTPPSGFTVRALDSLADADEVNRVYVRCGMVPAPVEVLVFAAGA